MRAGSSSACVVWLADPIELLGMTHQPGKSWCVWLHYCKHIFGGPDSSKNSFTPMILKHLLSIGETCVLHLSMCVAAVTCVCKPIFSTLGVGAMCVVFEVAGFLTCFHSWLRTAVETWCIRWRAGWDLRVAKTILGIFGEPWREGRWLGCPTFCSHWGNPNLQFFWLLHSLGNSFQYNSSINLVRPLKPFEFRCSTKTWLMDWWNTALKSDQFWTLIQWYIFFLKLHSSKFLQHMSSSIGGIMLNVAKSGHRTLQLIKWFRSESLGIRRGPARSLDLWTSLGYSWVLSFLGHIQCGGQGFFCSALANTSYGSITRSTPCIGDWRLVSTVCLRVCIRALINMAISFHLTWRKMRVNPSPQIGSAFVWPKYGVTGHGTKKFGGLRKHRGREWECAIGAQPNQRVHGLSSTGIWLSNLAGTMGTLRWGSSLSKGCPRWEFVALISKKEMIASVHWLIHKLCNLFCFFS